MSRFKKLSHIIWRRYNSKHKFRSSNKRFGGQCSCSNCPVNVFKVPQMIARKIRHNCLAKLQKRSQADTRSDQAKIKQLEKELQRKEKALAETAALLVLRKKANAFVSDQAEPL